MAAPREDESAKDMTKSSISEATVRMGWQGIGQASFERSVLATSEVALLNLIGMQEAKTS